MATDETGPGVASADAESPLQQFGYIRCHRAIVQSCGVAEAYLYGILEDYVQLGARTKRGAVPSHARLAELMGCSTRSITTYLNRLRERGWIRWETTNGKPSKYFLPNRSKTCRAGTQELQTTSAEIADNQEQGSKNKEQDTPLPPERGEYTPDFEAFWAKYPKVLNNSKKKAGLVWSRMKPEKRELAMAGLDKYLASQGWKDGFAPHAATYLNGALWESDPPPARLNGHSPPPVRPEERRPAIPTFEEALEPPKRMSPEKLAEIKAWRESRA
jgi:hypothetical protein